MMKKGVLIAFGSLVLVLIFSLYLIEDSATRGELNVKSSHLTMDGKTTSIKLPFVRSSQGRSGDRMLFLLEVLWREGGQTKVRVIPDDYLESVKVNGQDLAEARYAKPGRADWRNGLVLDFAGSLKAGLNQIELVVVDRGGGGQGLRFENLPYWENPARVFWVALALLAGCGLVGLALWQKKFDRILILILLLGLALQLISISTRKYTSYSYDLREGGTGHADYIEYIADKGALPPPDKGWSFYHPPLYYVFGAGALLTGRALSLSDPYLPVQLLSLIFHWIFIGYALALMRKFIANSWLFRLAALLLVLWPAGFINGLRLGNDTLLTACYAAGLFYGHAWFVKNSSQDLIKASLAIGLGFLAKISIFPLGLTLMGLAFWRFFKTRLPKLKILVWVTVIIGIGFSAGAVDNWYYALKEKHPSWYLAPFSNIGASADLRLFTNNRAVNFFIPNLQAWFESTWISSRDDATGRANYWNYLFKTSLYGEFSFSEPLRKDYLAPLLNLCLFFMVIISIPGLLSLIRRRHEVYHLEQDLPDCVEAKRVLRSANRDLSRWRAIKREADFRFVGFNALFLMALLMVSRIHKAMPALNDFRYVIAILPVFILMVVAGIERLAPKKFLFFASILVSLVFAFASGAFYFGL